MTPLDASELETLKEHNEILLAKLTGLQYELQIKECEEILNPIGSGVAGPESEPLSDKEPDPRLDGKPEEFPEKFPAQVDETFDSIMPPERKKEAVLKHLLDRHERAARHLKTEQNTLERRTKSLQEARAIFSSAPEEEKHLSDLAFAMRGYRSALMEVTEWTKKKNELRDQYLALEVGPDFKSFL